MGFLFLSQTPHARNPERKTLLCILHFMPLSSLAPQLPGQQRHRVGGQGAAEDRRPARERLSARWAERAPRGAGERLYGALLRWWSAGLVAGRAVGGWSHYGWRGSCVLRASAGNTGRPLRRAVMLERRCTRGFSGASWTGRHAVRRQCFSMGHPSHAQHTPPAAAMRAPSTLSMQTSSTMPKPGYGSMV
jgi:hypothetical protein